MPNYYEISFRAKKDGQESDERFLMDTSTPASERQMISFIKGIVSDEVEVLYLNGHKEITKEEYIKLGGKPYPSF